MSKKPEPFQLICIKCGEDLTGRGLLAWVEHPCNVSTVTYSGALPDGEMREAFMHIGMPNMVFEFFGYAVPTEMERRLYEDTSPYRKDEDYPEYDPLWALRANPGYEKWLRETFGEEKDDLS